MNTSQSSQIKKLQKQLDLSITKNIELQNELLKYQKQSTLNKYFQLFNRYQKLLRAILKENKASFSILLFLCENMDKQNTFHITQKELSNIFNIGERYVRDSLKLLENHKIIKVKKESRNNYYIVNSNISWKGSLQSKKRSLFNENPLTLDLKVEKKYKKSIKTSVIILA
jgi:predicted transcriptional regulator